MRYEYSYIRNIIRVMSTLDALFSKPEQQLMCAVLTWPGRDFGTLQLLKRMGTSRGAGSVILNRWVEAGLLRERRLGNQRRLVANPDFILYPELRRIVLKTVGCAEPLAAALAPLRTRLSAAFIFGSIAAGSDTGESDIDLALVGDVDLFAVSPLIDAAQPALARSVHVNLYTKDEWSSSDDAVLNAIKAGPRLDLMKVMNEQTG